ncbi:MAG TPA: hypothetical protein PLU22_13010 [Polyangiaceae bacterium]|nr:hypothetical protein [Polyangiaceae bacterium]
MWKDEIVETVRRAREAHAAAHDHDLGRIFQALKRAQAASGSEVVTLPPRPPGPPHRAAGGGGY